MKKLFNYQTMLVIEWQKQWQPNSDFAATASATATALFATKVKNYRDPCVDSNTLSAQMIF